MSVSQLRYKNEQDIFADTLHCINMEAYDSTINFNNANVSGLGNIVSNASVLNQNLNSYWDFRTFDDLLGGKEITPNGATLETDLDDTIQGRSFLHFASTGAWAFSETDWSPILGTDNATFSVWVLFSLADNVFRQVFGFNSFGSNQLSVHTESFTIQVSGDGFSFDTGIAPVGATWHHLCLVRDQSGVKFYFNGELEGEANASPVDLTNDLEFGDNAVFRMSQFAVWANRALTGDEVKILYNDRKSITLGDIQGNSPVLRTDGQSEMWGNLDMNGFAIRNMANLVNVKDFGAKGDDITDDTQAFNDALASISSGTIFIPKGTYILANWTVNKSNITVQGEGAGTILKLKAEDYGNTNTPDSVSAIKVFSGTSGEYLENVMICNLTANGNRDAGTTAENMNNIECIDLVYCRDCIITNCWAINGVSDGVDIDYGVRCIVDKVYADDCGGYGIHLSLSTEECGVTNCIASNCGDGARGGFDTYTNAIDCYFSNCATYDCYVGFELNGIRSRVVNCQAHRSEKWGFRIAGNARESLISGCFGIQNLNDGNSTTQADFEIRSNNAWGSAISDCLSFTSGGRAFRIDTADTCRIIGCRSRNATNHSLRIWNSNANIISGCYFRPNGANPTISIQESTNILIDNCIVRGPDTELDVELIDASDLFITGCRFLGSGNVDIDAESPRTRMSNCRLEGNLTVAGTDFMGSNITSASAPTITGENSSINYKLNGEWAEYTGLSKLSFRDNDHIIDGSNSGYLSLNSNTGEIEVYRSTGGSENVVLGVYSDVNGLRNQEFYFWGGGDFKAESSVETGTLKLNNIPTTDPNIEGAVWNDAGTLKISSG